MTQRYQNTIKTLTVLLLGLTALGINALQNKNVKQNQVVLSTTHAKTETDDQLISADFTQSQPQTLPKLIKGYPPSPDNMSAKSYLIYDLASKRYLAAYNTDQQLPIASLTKLTTALTVARYLSPQDVITVSLESIQSAVSPKLDLVAGEQISVYDLTKAMLVSSANDAAQVLAYALRDQTRKEAHVLMNHTVAEIGAKNTNFTNTTGFDDPQNYSTAEDVLLILQEIYRNPWLMEVLGQKNGTAYSTDNSISHPFRTTNQLLYTYSNIVTGGKTGFTENALGNLALFVKNPYKSDMIFILIGSQDREAEMSKLIDWTYNAYQW